MQSIILSIILSFSLVGSVFAENYYAPGVGSYTEAAKKPSLLNRALNFKPGVAIKNGMTAASQAPARAGAIGLGCKVYKKTCAVGAMAIGAGAMHYIQPLLKSDRTLIEQSQLENSFEFKNEIAILSSFAQQIDMETEHETNQCSLNVAQNLLAPSGEFNKYINPSLPKINDKLATLSNVDKYKNLKSKLYTMENDHIPSYKALEVFFENHGLQFNITKEAPRVINLNNNATAITINYDTHKAGRTMGNNNYTLKDEDGANSQSLRLATLKDFATILLIEKNTSNYANILNGFRVVYLRNKLLCLYNI